MSSIANAIVSASGNLTDSQFVACSVRLCDRAIDAVITAFDSHSVAGNLAVTLGAHSKVYWDAIEQFNPQADTNEQLSSSVMLSLRTALDIYRSVISVRFVSDAAHCVVDAGMATAALLNHPKWKHLMMTAKRAFCNTADSYSSSARCMSQELRDASVLSVSRDSDTAMSKGALSLRRAPLWCDIPCSLRVELAPRIPSAWELSFVSSLGLDAAAMHILRVASDTASEFGARASTLAQIVSENINTLASCDLRCTKEAHALQYWSAAEAWIHSERNRSSSSQENDESFLYTSILDIVARAYSGIAMSENDSCQDATGIRQAAYRINIAAVGLARLHRETRGDAQSLVESLRTICSRYALSR